MVAVLVGTVIAESALARLISCSHITTLTGKSCRTLLCPGETLEKKVVTMCYYARQCILSLLVQGLLLCDGKADPWQCGISSSCRKAT